jgi:hypothetical protein
VAKAKRAEPELTPAQDAALAALIGGASDHEAATTAGVDVAELRAWGGDPGFVAEANRRRLANWDYQADRLRALLPKALDVLAGGLDSADPRTQHAAALAILRAANWQGGRDLRPNGPTSARGVQSDWALWSL